MSSSAYHDPSYQRPPAVETTVTAVGAGPHIHRRLSWGAVLGGVFLVVTVQIVLTLLGAGIGLGTVDVNGGSTPDASSLGIGAGVWWTVASIVALGFGGYAAAWMAGVEVRWDGVLHGLLTWAVASMLTIWLLSSAVGGIVGGGASALGGLASTAASGVKSAAQPALQASGITPDVVQQQAQAYLKPANPDPASMSPQDAQKEIATDLATYTKGGADAQGAKNRIIAIMAAQQHISPDQASQQFNDAQAKLQQEKQQAIQTAKDAADATAAAASKTSLAAFAALLIGAIAAGGGGSLAVQRRLQVTRRTVA